MPTNRSASRLLYLALACAVVRTATPAEAEPLPCQWEHAFYRPLTGESYEIEFFGSHVSDRPGSIRAYVNRAGVIRYRGKSGLLEYEFAIVGAMPPSLVIIRNSSAARNPERDDDRRPDIIGPRLRMLEFAEGLGPFKKGPVWARYIILPDMTVQFRDWLKDRRRRPDMLPPQVWEMVPCSGDMPSRPKAEKLPPAPPSNLWWRPER